MKLAELKVVAKNWLGQIVPLAENIEDTLVAIEDATTVEEVVEALEANDYVDRTGPHNVTMCLLNALVD